MPRIEHLLKPLSVKTMSIKNRIVLPPMVTNYCGERGEVTPRLIEYLTARAKGGVGLIIVEASYVRWDGKGFVNQLGIHEDRLVEGLRQLTLAVHEAGARVAIQLFHAGRQTSSRVTGNIPVAPSAIAEPTIKEIPRELSTAEVEQLVGDYAAAARRALAAGFDAVEVHGAHGYLIAQFLSPFSNRRLDRYGGGVRNRARFALEVLERIRAEVGPEYPILFRLSAEERVDGGLTLDQTELISGLLVEGGADALHVSVGNYATPGGLIIAPMDVDRAPLVSLAAAIKRSVSVPVIAVDRLDEPLLAEQVLAAGDADLIAIGRGLLADPDLPHKIANGQFEDIDPCISCNQACIGLLNKQEAISCLMNPACGREQELAIRPAEPAKKVLVVGAGPAGLEAARRMAQRGHRVHLWEKEERLGGEFYIAAIPPKKEVLVQALKWMIRQVEKAGVDVRCGVEVTPEAVMGLAPDVVVVATGATPVRPSLPGIEWEGVTFARDVLLGRRAVGDRVLVVGAGPVGIETAEFLAVQRKRVTVIEGTDQLGLGLEPSRLYWVMETLRRHGADLLVETSLAEVRDGTVTVTRNGKTEALGQFDAVVLALGYAANNLLYQQLRDVVPELHLIGDASRARSAVEAILEGATVSTSV